HVPDGRVSGVRDRPHRVAPAGRDDRAARGHDPQGPRPARGTRPPRRAGRRGRSVRASLGVDYTGPADRPVLVSEGRRPAPGGGVLSPRRPADPRAPPSCLGFPGPTPPRVPPGSAAARLDTRGRLAELRVAPPARPDGSPTAAGTGWAAPLFAAAGLNSAGFT